VKQMPDQGSYRNVPSSTTRNADETSVDTSTLTPNKIVTVVQLYDPRLFCSETQVRVGTVAEKQVVDIDKATLDGGTGRIGHGFSS
jgi:hypothetical protein